MKSAESSSREEDQGSEVTKGGSMTDGKIHSISGLVKARNSLSKDFELERWAIGLAILREG